jgi:hypothetical protein
MQPPRPPAVPLVLARELAMSEWCADAREHEKEENPTMSDDRHEAVSRRAYELWEKEGGGHGRHEDHWHQAASEMGDDAGGNTAAPDGTTLADAPADQTPVDGPAAPPVKKPAASATAPTPADQTPVGAPAAPPTRAAATKPRKPKTAK